MVGKAVRKDEMKKFLNLCVSDSFISVVSPAKLHDCTEKIPLSIRRKVANYHPMRFTVRMSGIGEDAGAQNDSNSLVNSAVKIHQYPLF